MNISTNAFNVNMYNQVVYLTVPGFDIKHGISTRFGGISEGYYSSMNLGMSTNDSSENVLKNFEIFCNAINVDFNNLVLSKQTHHTFIRKVTSDDAGKGISKPMDYDNVDGLITNQKNIPLSVVFADCLPLLFYDPVKEIIGVAHSGWKGTVGGIAMNMIDMFKEEYNSSEQDIQVCIGPSIMKCCYEVDKSVADKFYSLDYINSKKCITPVGNEKYMLDLQQVCLESLLFKGLDINKITVTDLCTKCNKDSFFSHRGSNGKRGLGAAILSL